MIGPLIEVAERSMRDCDWIGAIRHWKEVQNLSSDQPDGFLGEANALIALGRIDDAEIILDALRKRFPKHLWIAHHFASVAVHRNDWNEALDRWRELQRLFPNVANGYVGEGEALIALGLLQEAENCLASIRERFPKDVWGAHFHASVAARSGDLTAALSRWREMQRQFPEHSSAYVGQAEVLASLNQFDDAELVLESAKQHFPSEFWVMFHYARLASKRSQWIIAVQRWKEVKRKFPDRRQSYDELVEAYWRCGELASAIAALEELELRFGFDRSTFLSRVEIAMLEDDPDLSLEAWRKVPLQYRDGKYFQFTCRLLLKWLDHAASQELMKSVLLEPDDHSSTWRPKLCETLFDLEVADYDTFRKLEVSIRREIGDRQSSTIVDVDTKLILRAMLGYLDADDVDFCLANFLGDRRQSIVFCMFHTCGRIFKHKLDDAICRLLDNSDSLRKIVLKPFATFNLLLLATVFAPFLVYRLLSSYVKVDQTELQRDLDESQAHAAICEIWSKVANNPAVTSPDGIMLSPAIGLTVTRSPRIAVCISGQLRGYQEAWASWKASGVFGSDCKYFVHTWKDIGRRFPERGHLYRCFSGQLLGALQRVMNMHGYEGLLARYPRLFSSFRQSKTVTTDQLKAFYDTEFVVVESEADAKFRKFSNSEKMYYKIEQCFDLIRNPDEFDVVVRMRPDREISSQNVDWQKILHKSKQENLIFSDFGRGISGIGYVMADQFGAGCLQPMRVYSRSFSFTQEARLINRFAVPAEFKPHVNLAFATLYGGVQVEAIGQIRFNRFFDPPLSDLSELHELIRVDIGSRRADDLDQLVLAACNADMQS